MDETMHQFKNIMISSLLLLAIILLAAFILYPALGENAMGVEVIGGMADVAITIWRLGMLI